MTVQGRSFTSNTAKLLKHLNKLKVLQDGGTPSPVMLHVSPCNPCNLTCSFCCFANRSMKEMLTLEQVKKALKSFRELGTLGVEFTGGGEPTLHPQFDQMVEYAHELGYKIGVCTNGSTLKKIKTWNRFSWVRLGLYGFDEGYKYDLSVFEGLDVKISGAYVWDGARSTSNNPNITGKWVDGKGRKYAKALQVVSNFDQMLAWVEENKIPTRIAFNAIKDPQEVLKDIEYIKTLLIEKKLEYAFLSDFNYKAVRRNDHCYMHMVKPFLFTDGNIYVCPSSELSYENGYTMQNQFKVCGIDDIIETYSKGVTRRLHDCKYCKYSMQNELIDDVLMETDHNEFA